MHLSKAKAKAIVAVRNRKAAKESADKVIIDKVVSQVKVPIPLAGRNGRDAPDMSEILRQLAPLLPTPKVERVTNTIVQKIEEGDIEGMVNSMLEAKIPEIEKSLRPKVELIREEISEEKLEGFLTKKEFDKALVRIQDAITAHSGGGVAPDVTSIANIIIADQSANVIVEEDLIVTKINIVHATVANSTVQLPRVSPNYVVWVEDAVLGGGNITITRV